MSSTAKIGDLLSGIGDAPLGAALHPAVVQEVLRVVGQAVDLSETDAQSLTATDLRNKLAAIAEPLAKAVNDSVIDPAQLKDQSEMELTQNLADVDPIGKTFRPTIALLMALLLFAAVIGYDILLWKVCFTENRLPKLDEMWLPIIAPGLIVISYFGFMKNERRELLTALLTKTPAGNLATGVAQRVLSTTKK